MRRQSRQQRRETGDCHHRVLDSPSSARIVREQLEHEFDLVSFHAQGLGDMAVEHLVGQRMSTV